MASCRPQENGGGALSASSGTVSVSRSAFAYVTSTGNGNGGALSSAAGNVVITGSSFASVSSTAGLGGAVFAGSGNVTMAHTAFTATQSALQGGSVYARNVNCTGGCAFLSVRSLRQVRSRCRSLAR